MKITVLSFYDRISLFQTLKPLLFFKDRKLFHYTQSLDYCLKEDRNRILFMFRWFLKPDFVDLTIMKKLREKYHRIFFFNGNAGAGIPRFEVLDYVDHFFNKALFRDKKLYQQDLYGDELYHQHYHDKYGIEYDNNRERMVLKNRDDLKKISLYWNIGIGDFPKRGLIQKAGVWMARKSGDASWAKPFHRNIMYKSYHGTGYQLPVSAQLGWFDHPFLDFHRKQYWEKIAKHKDFLTQKVPQRIYNRQLRKSKIVFSPFGWGELCFRDFEAIHSRALLMKPDMSHLETWPDIFKADETYVPLDWDGKDILEKTEYWLKNDGERQKIIDQASESYHYQLTQVESRLEQILNML